MKIECPVCHQEMEASAIKKIQEFECPHCHYEIEMEPFAAQLMQLFPAAAILLFIAVFVILKLFISEELLVIGFLIIFCTVTQLHLELFLLRWLGLLQFRRKVDQDHQLK